MSRRTYEVLLSLGSNIEARRWLPVALKLLRARFDVVAESPWYESPPLGTTTPQPPFVNLAVRARTDLPPRALREACRRVEEACGRRRRDDRFAPRTMDVDVVYRAGGDAHPDLQVAAYVLVPCADIWPDAPHPDAGVTLSALRERLPAGDVALLRRRGGSSSDT